MVEQFLYKRPGSLEEAFSWMREEAGNYILYAGGTDILVRLRSGRLHTKCVIDVKAVPELQGIRETETEIRIGAAATLREIADHKLIQSWYPALCRAAAEVGSVPIQNKATLAGNIQNASPAGDGLIAAFATDASVEVVSARGIRRCPLETHVLGPGKTGLLPGELVSAVILPKRIWTDLYFFKTGRRNALAISIVNGSVLLERDDGGTVLDCRIVLGAVAPKPLRIQEAERLLRGETLHAALTEEVGACVSAAVHPITDLRASAEYRKYLAGVLVKRQLLNAEEHG